MPEKHLMVIDPAVVKPAIESYNRMVFSTPYPVTYHLPALYGLTSIEQMKNNVRGIIIMGSAASVHDGNSWQHEITEILLDAFSENIPTLGLCYGHQLLAHIFGGNVGPLWSGEKKQGMRIVNIVNDPLWGPARSGPLVYSHQDGIIDCPPDFDVIAESNLVEIEGIASRSRPFWGFQPHIEATQAFVDHHGIPIPDPSKAFDFGHRIMDRFIMSLI